MPEERLKPLIVPIFIPHWGCPHRCAFCEQQRITSQDPAAAGKDLVAKVLEEALRSKGWDRRRSPEVAFYGGTFTMLPLDRMRELLEAVRPYLDRGLFQSIRVSTRPDALEAERIETLRKYGVGTVELGVQSMQDDVLALSRRGHTAADARLAVGRLKRAGFKVGVQLMVGLPGDTEEKFLRTVNEVVSLSPDLARLYPAVVIEGTALSRWYREGRYRPLGVEEAVELCVEGCTRLESAGIPVVRIGLMSSPALMEEGRIQAGPWHPAFGFLVRSAIHRKKLGPRLRSVGRDRELTILAPRREIPLVRGYENQGVKWIEAVTGAKAVRIRADEAIPPGEIKVVTEVR